jgi:hypothetical protein
MTAGLMQRLGLLPSSGAVLRAIARPTNPLELRAATGSAAQGYGSDFLPFSSGRHRVRT